MVPQVQERTNPHPMIDCPFYQGTGKCVSGCSARLLSGGEPRCITDEPVYGWRRRTPDGRFAPKETRMG